MKELFLQWALLGGLIYNGGYVVTLYKQYKEKKPAISNLSFLLFAFATMGYLGYFVDKQETLMAWVALGGLVLILCNLALSVFYGGKDWNEGEPEDA